MKRAIVVAGMLLVAANARAADGGFCAKPTDTVTRDACALAARLGEPAVLAMPSNEEGLGLRMFVSRPYRQPSIIRLNISSSTTGTLTVRSGGFVSMDRTVALSAGEIALLKKDYAKSEFSGPSHAAPCLPDLLVLVEAAEAQRVRTAIVCAPDDKFPVGAVIDELMRDKMGYRG